MPPRLPSRYEDLDLAFRGRLRPDRELIGLVQRASASMEISGGIRFLPIFGRSGSGKSSAARELQTHLPECRVVNLSRAAVQTEQILLQDLREARGRRNPAKLLVAVVDQYEENVADTSRIPTQFVERLSLLDSGELKRFPVLFLWLTTKRDFQAALAAATTRRERILLQKDFELKGPDRGEWAAIMEETFTFHNGGQPLADFEILSEDLEAIADSERDVPTLGAAIERVGDRLAGHGSQLQDLSKYQVIMLWPVADGHRITRVCAFSSPRDGYKLDWGAFFRELNSEDRRTLPLAELNRARLYFDVRIVPISAADLHGVCRHLEDPDHLPSQAYRTQFARTHFFSLVAETWDPSSFGPLRERDSERAREARKWYDNDGTKNPVALGRRIAAVLSAAGLDATHERTITTPHSSVRADICIARPASQQSTCIIELKAISTDGTRPSSIRDQIRTTLKRHAQLAGFLARQ